MYECTCLDCQKIRDGVKPKMELNKLFEIQRELDNHIREKHGLQGQDLLSNKFLALNTELGELANEQRSWKYWSEDQEPRTTLKCWNCSGNDTGYFSGYEWTGNKEVCKICSGTGINKSKNPLLEEYVDGLHFILSIGLELNYTEGAYNRWTTKYITNQFNALFESVSELFKSINRDWDEDSRQENYENVVEGFIGLGEMLGFNWNDIESAYMSKNKENHARQDRSY